jgi:hypothetical protein
MAKQSTSRKIKDDPRQAVEAGEPKVTGRNRSRTNTRAKSTRNRGRDDVREHPESGDRD